MVLEPNSPIINAGVEYCNGLDISKTAAKTMLMIPGAARDSTNTNDIVLPQALDSSGNPVFSGILPVGAVINGASVGPNGVDVAVLAANSLYAVYVIGDSTDYQPTAGLLSLSATQPSLPFGYDMYRRVGWVRTDGSSNLLQWWQYGEGQNRYYYYDVGISVLSAGAATIFTEVSLAPAVPAVATQVLFDVSFVSTSATDTAQFLPYGSGAANGIVRYGCGDTATQISSLTVPCNVALLGPSMTPTAEILYKVSAGSLTLLVTGFADFLT